MSRHDPQTALCTYDATTIFVRDRNLCDDLIGKVSFTRFLYFLIMGRHPSAAQEECHGCCHPKERDFS